MSEVDPLKQLTDLARMQGEQIATPADLREAIHRLNDGGQALTELRRRRRIRRSIFIAGATTILFVSGGVGIAALLSDQPRRPEQGPACRGGPSVDSPLYVLEAGADPISRCAELWETRFFPVGGESDGSVPPLIACIGPGGAVEVFPGPPDFCEATGLDPAATELDARGAAIAELSSRIIAEINLAECARPDVVRAEVERLLAELKIDGWTVVANPDSVDAACVKAQVDSTAQIVRLFIF